MEEILCIVIVWIIFGITILIFKKVYSPAILFTGLWTLIFTLYGFHLYGLFYADPNCLWILIGGIGAFVLGCVCSQFFRTNKKTSSRNRTYEINESFLEKLVFVSACILVYGAAHNLQNISLSVQVLRYGGEMNISLTYVILRDFFAVPIVFAVICFFLAKTALGQFSIKWMLYTFLLVALDIFALFEQLCIYALGVGIIFTVLYIFTTKKINIKIHKKIKTYFKYILIALVVLVIILANLREISLFEQIYSYLACSITLFSIDYNEFCNLSRDSFVGQYTYGLSSFQGVVRHLFAILERFGGSSELFDSASYFYASYLALPKYVTPGGTYNSFVTMFLYFYKDFGFAGMFIIPFFLGIIIQRVFNKFINNPDVYKLSIYIFFVIGLFFSYMQSPFVDKKFVFAIVILFISRKNCNAVKYKLKFSKRRKGELV